MFSGASEKNIIWVQKHDKGFWVTNEQDLFWERVWLDDWEPHTFKIFDIFLDPDHSFIDIGAWIGPTALYGCQIAKHCYAIEPDPVAFCQLKENFALNPALLAKATLSNLCIADVNGTVTLGNKTSDLGGDSMSSLLFADGPTAWRVPAVTLTQYLQDQGIDDCNFIKMDVEGAEALILPSIAELLNHTRPTLCLSLHAKYFDCPGEVLLPIVEVLEKYRHIYTDKWIAVDRNFILDENNVKGCYELICTDLEVDAAGRIVRQR
jgi:FkbM family methyltransferase